MPQVDQVTFFSQVVWLITVFILFYFIFSHKVINILVSNTKNREKVNIKRSSNILKYFFFFNAVWTFSNEFISYSCYLLNKLFFELFLLEMCNFTEFNSYVNHQFENVWVHNFSASYFYDSYIFTK